MKKIKDTKLGSWLKDKAPQILDVVGDLLPDSGGLGVVKNLIDKDPKVDSADAQAKIDAEVRFQENVTERWKADMGSDVKLAKLIRPVTLICLMAMFMLTMFIDSMDNIAFNVKDSYVSLLELLMLTAFDMAEEVLLTSHGVGKFGRCLGELQLSDPKSFTMTNLNKQLIEEGHAVEYHGGKR